MADERPIPNMASSSRDQPSSSWTGTPRAGDILARDIAQCSTDDEDDNNNNNNNGHQDGEIDTWSDISEDQGPYMYRRPSGVAYGTSRPVMNPQTAAVEELPFLSRVERQRSREAERSLLRDNHVLPPKHSAGGGDSSRKSSKDDEGKNESLLKRAYRRIFSTKVPRQQKPPAPHDEEAQPPSITVQRSGEFTPLLVGDGPRRQGGDGDGDANNTAIHEHLNEQWEAAVASGTLRTTWQRETKTIIAYAIPLVVTFLLQYSINVVAIFTVGKIGKMELGAVSLAAMTATITCYAPLQGLATSLDTLCAQAYGSGHRHLVGLQLQRMTCFLLIAFAPIAVLWWFSEGILAAIIPEAESAALAGQYLRVLILGGPGFVCFEAGKRFVQAQGLFRATTWVLLAAAPFNAVLTWLLVWRWGLGFVGAPVAVATTQNLLSLLLFLYVRFVDGRQCWGGFSHRAWSNWGVMLRLALPGMIMIQAEYMAFEILTLVSSRFGATHLAAQSVLLTLGSISYQIPFPVSIAASTRIANLMGAGLVDAAKTTGCVATAAAAVVGLFNFAVFVGLRFHLPLLFTDDPHVVELVAVSLPLVAVMQVFDSLGAGAHGLLRGIGRPSIGGYANLLVYYLIALPVSFGTAFGLDMKLTGLWLGVTVGLILVSVIEYTFVVFTDWEKAAREAESRNAAG